MLVWKWHHGEESACAIEILYDSWDSTGYISSLDDERALIANLRLSGIGILDRSYDTMYTSPVRGPFATWTEDREEAIGLTCRLFRRQVAAFKACGGEGMLMCCQMQMAREVILTSTCIGTWSLDLHGARALGKSTSIWVRRRKSEIPRSWQGWIVLAPLYSSVTASNELGPSMQLSHAAA